MRFSENWLREWVDPGVSREELCLRLDMLGLEVESVTELGQALDGIVVGRILSAGPHPDADRLQVCQVDIGAGEPLQIVCGAANARAGLSAPLARIGAQVGDMKIRAARLRGVESQGMLCSARELGLDEDGAGLMELPADAPVGAPLASLLGLPDASIELGLTPNRADCLGMAGLASDIAAAFDMPLTVPAGAEGQPVPATIPDSCQVHLDAGPDCPRYLGRVIRAVSTPAHRHRCGLPSACVVPASGRWVPSSMSPATSCSSSASPYTPSTTSASPVRSLSAMAARPRPWPFWMARRWRSTRNSW